MADQWTVGDLVDALEKAPRDAYLSFEWGHMPLGGWESYRGYYDRIALTTASHHEYKTVGPVLDELKADLGSRKVFVGYKGGDYPFDRRRLLHVSEHGSTSDTVVTGLRVTRWDSGGGMAEILTEQDSDA